MIDTTPLLYERNEWKGKAAYLAKRKIALRPRSGGPPLTIVSGSIKIEDISTSTDHVGTSIAVNYNAEYVGTFDPIYISGNASSLGFPWYGDYALGASGLVYCSHTTCKYAGGLAASSANPGKIAYTATFSPITPERLDLSPLDRPAIVSGGGIELTEVRRQDQQARPMVNSAGDFFENLPEFYVPGSEIQVCWNVADNPANLAQTYSFSTNQSSIWGQDAYSGVAGKITYEQSMETYSGTLITYWRITVPMKFRNDGLGWNFQPYDYGYRYNAGGQLQNWVDPVSGVYGPVFLDGSGGLLNGDGHTSGTDAVIFPSGSPPGYETLVPQDWSGLSVPLNPFS